MRLLVLSFCAGTGFVSCFTELPGWGWILPVSVIGLLMAGITLLRPDWHRPVLLPWMLLAGLSYVLVTAQGRVDSRLPPEWEGRDLLVEGIIQELPEMQGERLRFTLAIDRLFFPPANAGNTDPKSVPWQGNLRLSWYQGHPADFYAGERWQLLIRAFRPTGFMNPGGFDYERWMLLAGQDGSGYVRRSDLNRRLAPAAALSLARWRQSLRDAIGQLAPAGQAALLQGLGVADRSAIDTGVLEVLRRTGTSHLLAISGLHIG
ncbi:MAG: ComEC/Rec2 family competence protein, partial [Thiothrix sp.]|nr:ComEC/Rec2 family competence protein [Thiothrix sp.]